MNERIRELAEQAGIVVDFGESPYSELSEITKRKHLEVSEKFAELIVRECAGLFPNAYISIETEHGHTPVIAANYIKKHFGVE